MKTRIGVDNGVSGSIGIITPDSVSYTPTPIFEYTNYQKTLKKLNRINVKELKELFLKSISLNAHDTLDAIVLIERPMVNPLRFQASTSALRALEATLIVIEGLKIPYQFIDSKEWQKELLPKVLTQAIPKDMPAKEKAKIKRDKSKKLKEASLDVGKRLFPQIDFEALKFKDADGLLIAEYARRKNL